MNQIRFQIRPGTAARQAEQEAAETQGPPSMRISGGTAARRAEAERRESPPRQQGAAMMSLRATGGKPFGPGTEGGDIRHKSVENLGMPGARQAAPATASPASADAHGSASTRSNSSMGPLEAAVGRVHSFFETIFSPRGSSPTRDEDPTL